MFTGLDNWLKGKYGRSLLVSGLVEPPSSNYPSVYLPTPLDGDQRQYAPSRRHYYTWIWEERRLVISTTFNNQPRPRTNRKLPTGPATQPTSVPTTKVPQGYYQPALPRNPNMRAGGGGGIGAGNKTAMQVPYGHQYGPIDRPYSWTVKDVYNAHGWTPPPSLLTPKSTKPRPYSFTTATTRRYVPPQNPRSAHRVVGYDEYIDALACFDALARIATPGQRQAVDELISERDELAVDTNHSVGQANALIEPGFPQVHRGLTWLSALARVEVAAVRVAFMEQVNAFVRMSDKYDLDAFKHMVRDGLRSHYHALRSDPALAQVINSGMSPQVLSYLRRTQLTQAFLDATLLLHQGALTPQQMAQLSAWRNDLEQLENSLVSRLSSAPG